MKRFDLNILLQEGEGSMLEYKESLSAFHPNPEVRAQADVRQGTSTAQVPYKCPPRATDVNATEIGAKSAPSWGPRNERRSKHPPSTPQVPRKLRDKPQGKSQGKSQGKFPPRS